MAQGSIYTDQGIVDVSVPASADLSTKQFFAVTLDSNGRAAVSGANAKTLGILQNQPNALGDTARVRIQGISKAIVTETVSFGKFLTPTATGELEVVDAAGEEYCARAMGANVDNDQAEVQVLFGTLHASDA